MCRYSKIYFVLTNKRPKKTKRPVSEILEMAPLIARVEEARTVGGLPPLRLDPDLAKEELLEELCKVKNVLIVHGDQDEMVPVDHAFKIHEHLQSPKEIHIFPDGDHRLTNPEDRKKATKMTVSWLKRFL